MSFLTGLRTALAVAIMLAVLAGAYEAGGCGPLSRSLPAAAPAALALPVTAPGSEVAPTNTATAMAAAVIEEPTQAIPTDTAIRFAAYDPLEDDTLAHPHTYRRYVGTLNGQAIVLHLSVRANVQVKSYQDYEAGSWYYRYARQPAEHRLLLRHQRGGQLVVAEELPDHTATDTARVEWQFGWPLGRTARGRRRAVHGPKQQVVQLREDYSQAVRYELLRLTAHGSYCHEEPDRSQPYYSTEFLHLLGAGLQQLARWQAPPPAARRDSLRHRLLRDGSCQQVSQSLSATFNDFNLFSYSIWTEGYYYGAHGEHSIEGFIVDLSTGKELRVKELLRPGTEPALLKLLARYLRHDYPELNEGDNWHWKTVPPLPDSFTLTPSGLCADYSDYALTAYASHYANTTTIPYRELRPLVRPGTPLARMLRARGLW